ncbi:hypothetical protein [Lentilactobacillus parafarraginis]|uniref:hypothetical protein n=1 Tax=Lentilactobacillus parafarraginis TaxID=390842 RepID=UPI003F73E9BC
MPPNRFHGHAAQTSKSPAGHCLIGVLITVLASNATTSLSIIGYLFLLLGVCSYALYTVFVEKAVDFTGIEATYMMLIAGAWCLSPLL